MLPTQTVEHRDHHTSPVPWRHLNQALQFSTVHAFLRPCCSQAKRRAYPLGTIQWVMLMADVSYSILHHKAIWSTVIAVNATCCLQPCVLFKAETSYSYTPCLGDKNTTPNIRATTMSFARSQSQGTPCGAAFSKT